MAIDMRTSSSPSRSRDVAQDSPAPSVDDLIELLHGRGLRATPQRRVILRELRRCGRHSTVEEIRAAVGRELPGISTPTIYATLGLFVELGLVHRLDPGVGATLYDPRTHPHQHMVCQMCQGVIDFDIHTDSDGLLRAAGRLGFRGETVEISIHGVCAACAEGTGPGPATRAASRPFTLS
jgi:Fe2+ or Zn2+ uptake regulation protein